MDPFQILLDIQRDCKANAIEIPHQITTEENWVGIGFRSSGYNFVCPMNEITEILKSPPLTEIPSSQIWFRGTANLRGRILPVTDLQGFVTGTPHANTEANRVLIIKHQNASFGFSVEQVLGIQHFFKEERKPIDSLQELQPYKPYAEGAFELDHKPWIVMHFGLVVEDPKFYHVLTSSSETA